MKKALFPLVLAGIAGITTFTSCQKNYNALGSVNTPQSIDQLFSGLRSVPQNFVVPAGAESVVYAAQGTKMHFYANSFKDENGNIITSGTVDVHVVEMYKTGDMIANRATTMANGQILQSGGQINISATQNGKPVYANSYGLGFKHSNTSSTPMALFYGATNNNAAIATWTQSDTTHHGTLAGGTAMDTAVTHTSSMYVFDSCTNFTWANCDWFYSSDSAETSVSVILPDSTFNESNTQMYLVLPNVTRWGNPFDTFKAVMSNVETGLGKGSYSATTHTMNLISENKTNIVPSGMNYQLVVMTIKNGVWYYYEQDGIIPHNGLIATATMTQVTQQDVKAKLEAL